MTGPGDSLGIDNIIMNEKNYTEVLAKMIEGKEVLKSFSWREKLQLGLDMLYGIVLVANQITDLLQVTLKEMVFTQLNLLAVVSIAEIAKNSADGQSDMRRRSETDGPGEVGYVCIGKL